MKPIIPPKLKQGDTIRVIAPARSLSIISQTSRDISKKHFEELELNVEFSAHAEEADFAIS